MRILDNILEEINLNIQAGLNSLTDFVNLGNQAKFYRETTLQEKDGVTFPIIKTGSGKGSRAVIDNEYPLIIYHRVIDAETREAPDQGYGTNPARFKDFQMRLFVYGTLKKLNNPNHDYTTDLMQIIYDCLPVSLDQGEKVMPKDEILDIIGEEFAGATTKHLSVIHTNFAIDYTIIQRIDCGSAVTNDPVITLNNLDFITANEYFIT